MPFLEAVRLALQTIRVQKLKSFFTLIGVMTGSMMLLADLARSIRIPARIAVIQAGSYKGAVTEAGALLINSRLNLLLHGAKR